MGGPSLTTDTVVDAHVHFWDPDRLHYAWLEAEPGLRRAFVPRDLDPGSATVDSFVFVDAGCAPAESVAEVEWVLRLPAGPAPVRAVVARAALDLPATGQLEELAQHPEVVGVRRLVQDERPGFALAPRFVEGVRSLARRALVFDLCVRQHQLDEVTALVEQCPEVSFVLDHLGKPRVGARPDPGWLRAIRRLAALPNVSCKLSGLTSEVLDEVGRPTDRPFRPYLRHALECFGPARCMFGSDWPVASLTVTYEGWLDHVLDGAAELSSTELAQVLRGTARRVYRLQRPGLPTDEQPRADARVRPGSQVQEEAAADGAH